MCVPCSDLLPSPAGSHVRQFGLDGFYVADEAQILVGGPVIGPSDLPEGLVVQSPKGAVVPWLVKT